MEDETMLEFKGGLVLNVPDEAQVVVLPTGGVKLNFTNFTGDVQLTPARAPLSEIDTNARKAHAKRNEAHYGDVTKHNSSKKSRRNADDSQADKKREPDSNSSSKKKRKPKIVDPVPEVPQIERKRETPIPSTLVENTKSNAPTPDLQPERQQERRHSSTGVKRVRFDGLEQEESAVSRESVPEPANFSWALRVLPTGNARPSAAWGATLTASEDGSFYRIGGECDDKMLSSFFKWKPRKDGGGRWTEEDSHEARAWHSATKLGSRIIVFGGDTEKDGERTQTGDVVVYDTSFNSWFPPMVSGRVVPGARSGHCAISVDNQSAVLVFGGTYGRKFLNDVFRLDGEQYEWSEIEADTTSGKPCGRAYASLTNVGNQAVLFGGNNHHECFNDVHILEHNQDSSYHWWKPNVSGQRPKPRTGHGAFAAGGKLYIFGGWDYSSSSDVQLFDDMFMFDLEKFEWQKIKHIGVWPSARTGMGLAVSLNEKQALMVGGQDKKLWCTDQVYTLRL